MYERESVGEHGAGRKPEEENLRVDRSPHESVGRVNHRNQLEVEPSQVATLHKKRVAIERVRVEVRARGGTWKRGHENRGVKLFGVAPPREKLLERRGAMNSRLVVNRPGVVGHDDERGAGGRRRTNSRREVEKE